MQSLVVFVAVDKGVDVAVAVDVVLGNDAVGAVVLDDEIVVDVVLDDGIGVDVVLDDEVVVEVDEMVANGVAVVRLGVGFDVVAVTPRKKEVFNRFDNNQFICCSNSCVEFPCLYQLKIQGESYFKKIKLSLSFYMYIFFLVQP